MGDKERGMYRKKEKKIKQKERKDMKRKNFMT